MGVTPLRMQHSSLQVQDSAPQNRYDVEKIFAKGTEYPIKTGTESGPESHNDEVIRECAQDYKHAVHFAYGNWIAVDRKIVKPNSVKKGQVWVASNKEVVGKMHHRVFATLTFTHADPRVGRIAQAACHYPTKGHKPSDPNWDINRRYSLRIEQWMKSAGRGQALAFANGDFNMLDNTNKEDWSFGRDFTSMADELKAWQNTGHGPIDGFCSYDHDGRVKAKRFNVLDDKEFNLFTDHYLCRGVWEITHLKGKS